jgi:hypothetical protein
MITETTYANPPPGPGVSAGRGPSVLQEITIMNVRTDFVLVCAHVARLGT